MTARGISSDDKHLVLWCSRVGCILDVLCDDVGLFAAPTDSSDNEVKSSDRQSELEHIRQRVCGTMLSRFVAPGGTQHFHHLIARLNDNRCVSEWVIDLQHAGSTHSYRLWAATTDIVNTANSETAAPPNRLAAASVSEDSTGSDHQPQVLIVGTTDAACSSEDLLATLEARIPALSDHVELRALIAALRRHSSDNQALIADLRSQVRDLHSHVQPPQELENRLLRMAAHDLRNPLLVLSMGCSYLLHEASELNQEQRDMLSESLDTCEFMNRIIDGMTELAEVALGRLRLVRAQTELCELVETCVRHATSLADERSSSLTLVRKTEISLSIDPVRIARVLGQIVRNALIHSPEGSAIEVALDGSNLEAIITVADNGPGIRPELHERLFRPFGKPHGAIDPRHYGAGVGLTVARRIVEAHDGRIEVETAPGQGSSFRVILPRQLTRPAAN